MLDGESEKRNAHKTSKNGMICAHKSKMNNTQNAKHMKRARNEQCNFQTHFDK